MKIRIAKKIMGWNPNHKMNKERIKRFEQLRPPYWDDKGRRVYPSWHDIDIVRRARTRLNQWVRRYGNKKTKSV